MQYARYDSRRSDSLNKTRSDLLRPHHTFFASCTCCFLILPKVSSEITPSFITHGNTNKHSAKPSRAAGNRRDVDVGGVFCRK